MTTTNPLRAFHGSAAIKAKHVERMRNHIAADELIAGVGWIAGERMGGAVGCTFDSYDPSCWPTEIGYPEELLLLEDGVFESLGSPDSRAAFALGMLEAPEPGALTEMVVPRFLHWLMTTEGPMGKLAEESHVVAVHQLYQEWLDTGNKPAEQRWDAARDAARDAAIYSDSVWDSASAAASAAARAAARAVARVVAMAAARDAARAVARAVARAAARAAAMDSAMDSAWDAAMDSAWDVMAEKLIKLLSEAPVTIVELRDADPTTTQ